VKGEGGSDGREFNPRRGQNYGEISIFGTSEDKENWCGKSKGNDF